MNVQVYGPLRSATGSKTVRVGPDSLPEHPTVRDVLDALCAAHPRTESHLSDGDGSLRPSVRVTVDGDRAAIDDDCPADAEVRVFPAMRGG
ncbi:ubiquitin-like small modifier protein 1 [Halobaculum rubrum]|uniref:ubiquitin-like small modifier protein 1 n=1 Tax=Halobaculum rubrum TaxID=2872158 RepID=UPI001CA41157|nr:ubiquitin-like small modifier protein 1 [Halobaculum rubrum]QZX99172.1 MoaD/ThiS family protein [Halobaculum rubrum]